MGQREDFSAIILAAGKGTRMSSPMPKVLHPVAGDPMILRVLNAVEEAGVYEKRVVVGYKDSMVRQVVEPHGANCFKQEEQKGTGHAVKSADPSSMSGILMILNGDHPLITSKDIKNIIKEFLHTDGDLALVTAKVKKPGQLGRVVRQNGELRAVVEAKDAGYETLKINEVNTGIYVVKAELLNELLPQIKSSNAQNEFYLTDIISLAQESGKKVSAILADARVAFGVNSQKELAIASNYIFRKKSDALMESGVMIVDPKNTYIEDDVEVGEATLIQPGCHLKSGSKVGKYCVIEPNCFLTNAKISDSVTVLSGSYLEDCSVGESSSIGPYARLRPGTKIGSEAKIGNFVEMKKVEFGDRSKAGHLTYLGDAIIGEDTNIGCGTITCNYAVDKKKYVTEIGSNVFVGSDTQFIAPVKVGDNSFVASGSTVTKDVPDGALAVARGKQFNKENYKPKSTNGSEVKKQKENEKSLQR